MRRLGDFRHIDLAVERLLGDAVGARPVAAFGDRFALAVTGEGELAGQMAIRVLINDAANIVRIEAREGAVDDHLRHGLLAFDRLAARFKIDRIGETALGLGVFLALELQPLRRRRRRHAGRGSRQRHHVDRDRRRHRQ